MKENDDIFVIWNDGKAGKLDDKDSSFIKIVDMFESNKNVYKKDDGTEEITYNPVYAKADKVKENSYYVILPDEDVEKKSSESPVGKEMKKQEFVTQETKEKIRKYLTEMKIPMDWILMIMSTWKDYGSLSEHIYNGSTLFVGDTATFKDAVANVLCGNYTRLIGDAGCGKNTLVNSLSFVFQRPLFTESINVQTDKLDVKGEKSLEVDEESKASKIVFNPSALVKAMEGDGEHGCFYVIDEINMAQAGVLSTYNIVMDDRCEVDVDGRKVVGKEGFFVFATMNLGDEFEGTMDLNQAIIDRMSPIRVPSKTNIRDVLEKAFPTAPNTDLDSCERIYEAILKSAERGTLPKKAVTVRGFIRAMKVANLRGLARALYQNVSDVLDEEPYRAVVDNLIASVTSISRANSDSPSRSERVSSYGS